jgi:hypothetical protein
MSLPWMLKSHTSKSYTNSMMSNPANSLDCLFAQCLPSGQEGVKYQTLYFWSSHQTTMALCRNDNIFMPGPPQDLKKNNLSFQNLVGSPIWLNDFTFQTALGRH